MSALETRVKKCTAHARRFGGKFIEASISNGFIRKRSAFLSVSAFDGRVGKSEETRVAVGKVSAVIRAYFI